MLLLLLSASFHYSVQIDVSYQQLHSFVRSFVQKKKKKKKKQQSNGYRDSRPWPFVEMLKKCADVHVVERSLVYRAASSRS